MSKDPQYLAKLQDYYADQGIFPPYSAIGELLGLRSKSSVAALVNRLREAGFLDATEDRRLKPGPRFFERPLAESVRAGHPQTVEEAPAEGLRLDQHLVETPSRTVLVNVRGDSMKGAGILEGDIAVVERQREARAGDIVIAIVDGEFTLKHLGREGEAYVLRPDNPTYPVIRARGSLEIYGVVVGIVRKYGR